MSEKTEIEAERVMKWSFYVIVDKTTGLPVKYGCVNEMRRHEVFQFVEVSATRGGDFEVMKFDGFDSQRAAKYEAEKTVAGLFFAEGIKSWGHRENESHHRCFSRY
jgi:hypothetical protein